MIHLTSVFICLNCPRAHWKWNAFCSCTLEATALKQNSLRIIYKASCEKWQIYEILLIFWQRNRILRENFLAAAVSFWQDASCFVTHSKQTPRNRRWFYYFRRLRDTWRVHRKQRTARQIGDSFLYGEKQEWLDPNRFGWKENFLPARRKNSERKSFLIPSRRLHQGNLDWQNSRVILRLKSEIF